MKATLGWLAGLFAGLMALIIGAFRAGGRSAKLDDAEDDLDAIDKAKAVRDGVDHLPDGVALRLLRERQLLQNRSTDRR